jgi:hypothetical protein
MSDNKSSYNQTLVNIIVFWGAAISGALLAWWLVKPDLSPSHHEHPRETIYITLILIIFKSYKFWENLLLSWAYACSILSLIYNYFSVTVAEWSMNALSMWQVLVLNLGFGSFLKTFEQFFNFFLSIHLII